MKAKKLTRAVKAHAKRIAPDGAYAIRVWAAEEVIWSEHNCYIVPAKLYETLRKQARQARGGGK